MLYAKACACGAAFCRRQHEKLRKPYGDMRHLACLHRRGLEGWASLACAAGNRGGARRGCRRRRVACSTAALRAGVRAFLSAAGGVGRALRQTLPHARLPALLSATGRRAPLRLPATATAWRRLPCSGLRCRCRFHRTLPPPSSLPTKLRQGATRVRTGGRRDLLLRRDGDGSRAQITPAVNAELYLFHGHLLPFAGRTGCLAWPAFGRSHRAYLPRRRLCRVLPAPWLPHALRICTCWPSPCGAFVLRCGWRYRVALGFLSLPASLSGAGLSFTRRLA